MQRCPHIQDLQYVQRKQSPTPWTCCVSVHGLTQILPWTAFSNESLDEVPHILQFTAFSVQQCKAIEFPGVYSVFSTKESPHPGIYSVFVARMSITRTEAMMGYSTPSSQKKNTCITTCSKNNSGKAPTCTCINIIMRNSRTCTCIKKLIPEAFYLDCLNFREDGIEIISLKQCVQ